MNVVLLYTMPCRNINNLTNDNLIHIHINFENYSALYCVMIVHVGYMAKDTVIELFLLFVLLFF